MSNLNVIYYHSYAITNKGYLIDCGANGGLYDTDVRIIEKTGCSIDIQGIDNHKIIDVHIFTAGVFVYA